MNFERNCQDPKNAETMFGAVVRILRVRVEPHGGAKPLRRSSRVAFTGSAYTESMTGKEFFGAVANGRVDIVELLLELLRNAERECQARLYAFMFS